MLVKEGRTAVINCPVFGSPEPSIAWLRNGQPLRTNNRHAILNGGRQLEISDISAFDEARCTLLIVHFSKITELFPWNRYSLKM